MASAIKGKCEKSGCRLKSRAEIRIAEGVLSLACLDAVTLGFNGIFFCLLLFFFVSTCYLHVSSKCPSESTPAWEMFYSNTCQGVSFSNRISPYLVI